MANPTLNCNLFCREINPDVEFEIYNYNITTMDNFDHFMDRVRYRYINLEFSYSRTFSHLVGYTSPSYMVHMKEIFNMSNILRYVILNGVLVKFASGYN